MRKRSISSLIIFNSLYATGAYLGLAPESHATTCLASEAAAGRTANYTTDAGQKNIRDCMNRKVFHIIDLGPTSSNWNNADGKKTVLINGNLIVSGSSAGLGNVIVGSRHNTTTTGVPKNKYESAGTYPTGCNGAYPKNSLVAGNTNAICGFAQTIVGGTSNTGWSDGNYGAVIGGSSNDVRNDYAAVIGGYLGNADGLEGVVVGGYANTLLAPSYYGVVIGGGANQVNDYKGGVAAGGASNRVGLNPGGTVATNEIGPVVTGGHYNTSTQSGAVVAGGSYNQANANYSTVVGGGAGFYTDGNMTSAAFSTILGGYLNSTYAGAIASVVVGGSDNNGRGTNGVVVGGLNNGGGATSVTVNAEYPVTVGGRENGVTAKYGVDIGGYGNLVGTSYSAVSTVENLVQIGGAGNTNSVCSSGTTDGCVQIKGHGTKY